MQPLTKETASLLRDVDWHEDDRLRIELDKKMTHFVLTPFRLVKRGDEYRESNASWRMSSFLKRFPERRQLTDRKWTCGATDISAAILHKAPKSQLLWQPDAQLKYQYLRATSMRQGIAASNVARFRQNNLLPVHEWNINEALPLARYQELGLCNSMHAEGYNLFMEQGTGKTAVVIARLCNEAREHRAKTGRPYFCIIVCPKQVRLNWQLEIQKFATTKGRVCRLMGTELDRVKLLIQAAKVPQDEDFTVVVTTYETLRLTPALMAIKWDLAVLDESHYAKTPSAKRTKAVLDLRDAARQRMCLTGTPVTNSMFDLYSQFEFLGEGWSGFSSFEAFKTFYGVFDKNADGTGFKKFVGLQNLPFIQERLARTSLVVKKEEALPDLPPKTYDVYEVEMSKAQQEVYDNVATNLVHEIEDELDSSALPKQVVAQNILTKLLRLAQITAGFITYDAVVDDDGTVLREGCTDRFDPDPKLEALVEILKEKERHEKTIVWSCWVPNLKTINARLKLEGIDSVLYYGQTSEAKRNEAVRRFNEDPKCKVFVANQAAGGTGLNLHGYPANHQHADLYDTNCNHEIYYSQNWSMPVRAQSEDRAHRRGTRTTVRITDLVVPNTIDLEIRERVTAKIDAANFISDLRAVLRNVFNRNF